MKGSGDAMGIVLKWNFKTLFSDIPRLLLSLLSIASTYALLTGLGLALTSFAIYTGTINEGLPHYIDVLGPPVVQFSFAATMYVLFAVSIAERKDQYRLMRSAGCTTRQLVQNFLAEALALDAAGGLPGAVLGIGIAKLQLDAVGLPMAIKAYFFSTDAVRGLLPVFLLVPLMLLLASVQLWVPPKNRRRKQPRKDRPPFKKRLFPRLFGAGGRLEYAFSKNERRHRWGVVFSVVANLSILFLLTAGVSALSATDELSVTPMGGDNITFACRNALNADLPLELDALLSRFCKDGLCGEYNYNFRAAPFAAIVENAELTVKAPENGMEYHSLLDSARFRDGHVRTFHHIYPLDEKRSLLLLWLYFLDDEGYDAITAAAGIDGDANSGLLVVGDAEQDYEGFRWDRKSTEPLRLQTVPASLWKQIQEKEEALEKKHSGTDENRLFDQAELTLSVNPEAFNEQSALSVEAPIAGKIRQEESGIHSNMPEIIFPFRAVRQYSDMLSSSAVLSLFFSGLARTDSPAVLIDALERDLEAKGYAVISQKFGDGTDVLYRKENEAMAAGKTVIEIDDWNANRKNAGLFITQAEQFFFRYFTVMIFLSIALNIVNIVHMNRLSRRREYAILTSIGLSRRQRLGMSLYESFWFTLQTVFCGSVVLVVFARILSPSASDAYSGEMLQSSVDWNVTGWYREHAFFEKLWNTAVNLAITLKPYWVLILFTIVFLFFGYLITETLVNMKMDKDELIPTLKDDMYE